MRVFPRTMASISNRVIYNGVGSALRMVHSHDGNSQQNDAQTISAAAPNAVREHFHQLDEVRLKPLPYYQKHFRERRER